MGRFLFCCQFPRFELVQFVCRVGLIAPSAIKPYEPKGARRADMRGGNLQSDPAAKSDSPSVWAVFLLKICGIAAVRNLVARRRRGLFLEHGILKNKTQKTRGNMV